MFLPSRLISGYRFSFPVKNHDFLHQKMINKKNISEITLFAEKNRFRFETEKSPGRWEKTKPVFQNRRSILFRGPDRPYLFSSYSQVEPSPGNFIIFSRFSFFDDPFLVVLCDFHVITRIVQRLFG